ncbi:MAG: tetratricopeptide repeat protein [Myxococcales bacterium]|nr:tetratricopeptide repeat protein [Myxococcales bacterium]
MNSRTNHHSQHVSIRGILYSSILLILLSAIQPAHADDFDALFRKGMTLYQKKDYEGAVDSFSAAYKIHQFPRVMLNIAQVYRKMGNAQLALDFYQQYMKAEPNPPAKIRADVEQYIQQTKAMLEAPSLLAEDERRKEPAPMGFDKQTGQLMPWYVEAQNAQSARKKKLLIGIISGSVAAAAIIGVGVGVGLYYRNKLPEGLTIFTY